jgi:glycosyltransferase involved in cell wall biosynthesis
MCRVSIVIPCFNQGDWLPDAIASVEKHRNENIREVIVVNDGSTDGRTLEELEKLESGDYKVLHQPNLGLGAARNNGIKLSTGEFILPLDADNRIRGAYLNRGVEVLRSSKSVGVVYGNAEYFGEKVGDWIVPEFDPAKLVMGNYIDACALFRRTAWEEVGGYDEKMPEMGWEDWDLWLRLFRRGWRFHHVHEKAFDYRVRIGSMITTANNRSNEILAHIFSKPELDLICVVREKQGALELATRARDEVLASRAELLSSKEYRLGKVTLAPLRKLYRQIAFWEAG